MGGAGRSEPRRARQFWSPGPLHSRASWREDAGCGCKQGRCSGRCHAGGLRQAWLPIPRAGVPDDIAQCACVAGIRIVRRFVNATDIVKSRRRPDRWGRMFCPACEGLKRVKARVRHLSGTWQTMSLPRAQPLLSVDCVVIDASGRSAAFVRRGAPAVPGACRPCPVDLCEIGETSRGASVRRAGRLREEQACAPAACADDRRLFEPRHAIRVATPAPVALSWRAVRASAGATAEGTDAAAAECGRALVPTAAGASTAPRYYGRHCAAATSPRVVRRGAAVVAPQRRTWGADRRSSAAKGDPLITGSATGFGRRHLCRWRGRAWRQGGDLSTARAASAETEATCSAPCAQGRCRPQSWRKGDVAEDARRCRKIAGGGSALRQARR